MRDANPYNIKRALPRMSWHPKNLYNLWCRSLGQKVVRFHKSDDSLFQQRWQAKRLVRAYHGDYINEKLFKRWYLPATLPDVRPRKPVPAFRDDSTDLLRWAGREETAEREEGRKAASREQALAPVASLMFSEVERRIDVFVFRCCFAHSVYEARRMVIHGNVMLNGVKHHNANTRLAPGDMISVNPEAIRLLRAPPTPPSSSEDESASESESEGSQKPKLTETQAEYLKATAPKTLTPFHLPPYASPCIFIPAYIEVSFPTCSAVYVRHPTARPGYSEIPTPYDADGEIVRLAWEWYAKVRPRIRSESQWAREPDNRK